MTKTNINWGRFLHELKKKCAAWTQIIDKKYFTTNGSIFLNRFPWRENRRFKAALVNYFKDTLYYISVCSYSVHPLLILFACVFIDKHFFLNSQKNRMKCVGLARSPKACTNPHSLKHSNVNIKKIHTHVHTSMWKKNQFGVGLSWGVKNLLNVFENRFSHFSTK